MSLVILVFLFPFLTCIATNCRYFKYALSEPLWVLKPLDICMISYSCGKALSYQYVCDGNSTNSGVLKQFYDNGDCSGDIASTFNLTTSTFVSIQPIDCTPSTYNNLPLCDYAKYDKYSRCNEPNKLHGGEYLLVATNICFDVPRATYDLKFICNETGVFKCTCDIQNAGNCVGSYSYNSNSGGSTPAICDTDSGQASGLYCNGINYDIITLINEPTIDGSLYSPSPTTINEIECENYGLIKYFDSGGYMSPRLWNVIDVCVPEIDLVDTPDNQRLRTEMSWIKYCQNGVLYQRYHYGSLCENDPYETEEINFYSWNVEYNCSVNFDYKTICKMREYGIVERYDGCDTEYDLQSTSFTIILNECTIDDTGCNVKFVCDENGNGIQRIAYASDDNNCLGEIVNSKIEYTNYTCQDQLTPRAQAFYCNGEWYGKLYSIYYDSVETTDIPTKSPNAMLPTKSHSLSGSGRLLFSVVCKCVLFMVLINL
eukprot:487983_1